MVLRTAGVVLRTAGVSGLAGVGVRKRKRCARTGHEQPRRHQACGRGDTYTRFHVITNPSRHRRPAFLMSNDCRINMLNCLLVYGTSPIR
jgi:hypothetical protein